MKTRIFLPTIFATVFCLSAWAVDPGLKLDPASATAKVGDSLTLTVVAENVTDLFGVSFDLAFDETLLEFQNANEGDFLGGNLIFQPFPAPGKITIAISKKRGSDPVSGIGKLAEIAFTVKAAGETEVTFIRDTLALLKPDGSFIEGFDNLTLGKTLVNPTQPPPVVEGGPRLKIEAAATINVGDSLTLTIMVEDVVELFGVSFDLAFDETLLEFQNANEGDFLGGNLIFQPFPAPGKITIAISKKRGSDPVSGTGKLAEIAVTAKAAGETQVTFIRDTLALLKSDGSSIPEFDKLTLGIARVNILPPTEPPPESPGLRIEPETTTVNVGGSFTLTIVAEKVTDLFGTSFDLAFDETLLEFQNANEGDFLGSDLIFQPFPAPGKITLAMSMKRGSDPVSGSGKLAEIAFTVKGTGETEITFIRDTLALVKPDASSIPRFNELALGTAKVTIEDRGVEVEFFEGTNMISIPLDPGPLASGESWKLSNLAEFIDPALVTAIIWFDAEGVFEKGKFITFMPGFPSESPADKTIRPGDGYIVLMKEDKTVRFTGEAWKNRPPAAPAFTLSTGDATPVLIVEGVVEQVRANRRVNGLNVTLKNQTTQQVADDVTGFWARDGQYILLLTDFGNKRAARIGDELEIRITSPSGELGGEILTHTVQPRDVNDYVVSIGTTSLAPKPKRSELLQNFPNPFNPETWIPFKLAHDAEVTISIFATSGTLVRTLHLGHKVAASYLSKEKAAYWDGHNILGEKVSSGVYFYTIRAADFTAVRKLLILK